MPLNSTSTQAFHWIVVDRDGVAHGCIDHWDYGTACRIAATVFPELDRGLRLVAWSVASGQQRRDVQDAPSLTLRTAMKLIEMGPPQVLMERRPKRRPQAREIKARQAEGKLQAHFARTGGGH